jgi:polyisoprenoid-binding protein YceI
MIRKIQTYLVALFLTASFAQASEWGIDPQHSGLAFRVKHMMISNVKGRFEKFDVQLNYDETNLSNSSVKAVIETASISTDNEKRDTHLRSADFFDVEKFPQATFISRRFVKTDEGIQVIGDLTIRGVTREVTVNIDEITPQQKDPWGGTRFGVSASAKLDRTAFGLLWNQTLETGGVLVDNDVYINIDLEMVKK